MLPTHKHRRHAGTDEGRRDKNCTILIRRRRQRKDKLSREKSIPGTNPAAKCLSFVWGDPRRFRLVFTLPKFHG
jgi:hypothetical protein